MPDTREFPILSACGLNCGLCPRYYTDGPSRCPGCGGENFAATRPTCSVIRCNGQKNIDFCYDCAEYPCDRLANAEDKDSFITHRNMRANFAQAKEAGLPQYLSVLEQKMAMLRELLETYNDGRRKSLFCTAVNLLPLASLQTAMAALAAEAVLETDPKARARLAAATLTAAADAQGISLKLRK